MKIHWYQADLVFRLLIIKVFFRVTTGCIAYTKKILFTKINLFLWVKLLKLLFQSKDTTRTNGNKFTFCENNLVNEWVKNKSFKRKKKESKLYIGSKKKVIYGYGAQGEFWEGPVLYSKLILDFLRHHWNF